ncbi:TSL-kinase interacting protein 1 isoform X1 [Nicotiana tabacum]|uniref:TSL-kinase interacting protein 1 isoform X1 n=4 Tax=Nicotiana TaxID=4085 RepID=A0A1S3ZWN2_TOBAC|nr:PREDICTED: TSL-kinase interacting protein 1 isoform X4 [Nicotiana sylvestris]XP_009802693.1 PREDICTED: TSL-kinase interacting protein 1 isoform X4 [Nicotiana sylvestris]XP_009802694.1 PREDICTED: TSL-kinase interacting protein 1 isoform X4 [Nicotiana sylvestris]XP_009802695.1 PREDICTED: TSL-kinase interacting protein 1 isoform X4 [Nicotiana sylvestris]XP_009802696.1 PREDICTED: TSL-kinase interacting protein 1 isoform X4 [Nicotiana sylvestris]XP_009802697.1 PREDICTED: TSL-kinase interacting p
MQMEPQVSLECDRCLHPETLMCKDGVSDDTQHPAAAQPVITSEDHPAAQLSVLIYDHAVTQQVSLSQDQVMLQKPAKRQTRQWAAWTRQEEESFFSALRQVGKNFEKITSRVQSKNKDQVRHYYYRLVRRMNKLLGPELSLDAKNSKDTNAAMLRWWSLLEKSSCKASKLHLKPRRFKIFIETLESQLLKDRKKNVRRRPSQGESSSTAAASLSSHSRVSTNDSRTVKVVLLDNQDVQKFGSGKGSSLKRHVTMGVNRSNTKVDSSPVKNARHRRKIGSVSTAAYKRWEKAAIAGVSLVADAAEHLERATIDKDVGLVQNSQGINGFEHVGKDVPSLPTLSQNLLNETNLQSCMKLKLQLFPVDEGTRRALEMDNHNPYLELTLSNRKKMSSILEHLNRKWGSSSIATGKLVLFPYHVQMENLVQSLRWTKDTTLSAADVYNLIGSPPVFRLRYGWFPNSELGTFQAPLSSTTPFTQNTNTNITEEKNEEVLASSHGKLVRFSKEPLVSNPRMTVTSSSTELSGESNLQATMGVNTYNSDHNETLLMHRRDNGAITTEKQVEMHDMQGSKNSALSAGDWEDSLTNISVGDLLSDAPDDEETDCIESTLPGSSHFLQQMPFSCDSFDAAIAAHIYKHQSKAESQMALPPQASSIWNAEDTCDAFAFQKDVAFRRTANNSSSNVGAENRQHISQSSSLLLDAGVKDLPGKMEPLTDELAHEDPVDECHAQALGGSTKDLSGLSDIYWPDSLGPLELDAPSCRYHSEDLILSDNSLGGLNRLIASSLDAFQNCSFFGLDKKEPGSTVEAVETTSLADYKIGAKV